MMGGRVVIGRKGSTVAAGMHLPLIANWPGHIAKSSVCGPDEKSPLKASALDGDAALAAPSLQSALDQFKDARPAQ